MSDLIRIEKPNPNKNINNPLVFFFFLCFLFYFMNYSFILFARVMEYDFTIWLIEMLNRQPFFFFVVSHSPNIRVGLVILQASSHK